MKKSYAIIYVISRIDSFKCHYELFNCEGGKLAKKIYSLHIVQSLEKFTILNNKKQGGKKQ